MANIINMMRLHNKPDRNPFDMSENVAFTSCLGAYLPVTYIHLNPGDKIKENFKFFSRTEPVRTAAFGRIKEHFDFFFVPYSQVFKQAREFFTQMPSPSIGGDNHTESVEGYVNQLPYITPDAVRDVIEQTYGSVINEMNRHDITDGNNKIGWSFYSPSRAVDMNRLLNYLGFGKFVNSFSNDGTDDTSEYDTKRENSPINALPLLAYHKIYYDFFRNTQWENNQPHMFWFDYDWDESSYLYSCENPPLGPYIKEPHLFDLHYCDYEKDKYLGVFPSSQFGKPAIVDLSLVGNVQNNPPGVLAFNTTGNLRTATGGTIASPTFTGSVSVENLFNFSVLALREQSALQKWKEISQFNPTDYKHQIKAHFGFDVDDARSNLVTFIDGCSSFVDINPVVNTNLQEPDNDKPYIFGKGDNVASCDFEFTAPEHGILMCIYHAKPLVDYNGETTMIAEARKIWNTDFPIPEMDSTGLEPVLNTSIDLRNGYEVAENDGMPLIAGYAPRYIDFKSRVDRVLGGFCHDADSWVIPLPDRVRTGHLWHSWMDPDAGPINQEYCRFKVSPDAANNIFFMNPLASRTDPNGYPFDILKVDAMFDCTKVSNMNLTGMPY